MTVESITSKVFYYGNGQATTFPVTFQYSRKESLRLALLPLDGSEEAIDDNFEVVVSGGVTNIEYPVSGAPLPVGHRLTIFRDTEQSQIVALKFGGAFSPSVLEYDGFDRAVMMIQEIQEEVDRSVKVGISSSITPDDMIDSIFATGDAATASAEAAAESAASSQVSANSSALSASSAAVSAQEALDRMNGTIHKSRVFNVRASWVITADTPTGSILTLPESYFPTRNHMLLHYNGVLCELMSASGDGIYQYSEVGSVDVESTRVVLDFPVYNGDRFDMFAVASGVLQDLDALEYKLIEATALLSTIREDSIPERVSMHCGSFATGVREGLYHPVHLVTGSVIYSLGLCNGEVYDLVSASGTYKVPDLRGIFVKGADYNSIGESGGSETHDHGNSGAASANVSVANTLLTYAHLPIGTLGVLTASSGGLTAVGQYGAHGPIGGGYGHGHGLNQTPHVHTNAGANSNPPYYKLAYVMAL